ncbi:MAG: NifU family protein [Planctomycetes bacterium]|nr:NifU family protein [Planctomycetota bacterium]
MSETVDLSEIARKRLGELRFFGEFTETEAQARALSLVSSEHGLAKSEDHIKLSVLIDENNVVKDVRYRSLATGVHMLTFEMMAEYCVGKSMTNIAHITPQDLTQFFYSLTFGCDASSAGAEAVDKPYFILVKISGRVQSKETVPVSNKNDGSLPTSDQLGWDDCGLFEKVRRIEVVLDEHVRPALASDGGGIDLIDLREPELVVQYNGACGSCGSSVGGTMHFIEDTLEANLGMRFQLVVEGADDAPFLNL